MERPPCQGAALPSKTSRTLQVPCAQTFTDEPCAKDASPEAMVAPGCHPPPEEQTDSLSPAGQDTLTELCVPGESRRTALGTAAAAGRSLDGLCIGEGVSRKPTHFPDLCRHTSRLIATPSFTALSGMSGPGRHHSPPAPPHPQAGRCRPDTQKSQYQQLSWSHSLLSAVGRVLSWLGVETGRCPCND